MSITVLFSENSRGEQVLFASDFPRNGTNGWRNVPLFKRLTDYSLRHEGTNCFVHASADDSCSALTRELNLAPPKQLRLRWSWRIAGVNTNGSERQLARFDHAARVFVAFDTLIGPPRTLNYFWADTEPPNTFLEHPMTGRAWIVVVESGDAKAGQWVREERDVTADWRRVFPGKKMPKIKAVGLLTDADSLGTPMTGDYAAIELIAE